MWDFNYSSTADIKKLLEENGFSMQKKFGQNFLIAEDKIRKIKELVTKGLLKGETVNEIGPGIGVLTAAFVRDGYKVHGFEIDRGFISILRKAFGKQELMITEGDAAETLFEREECPKVLCGNLPYNISAVLIAKIIEKPIAGDFPERMVFLLQKEVAEKFTGKCKSSLSLLTELSYKSGIAFEIPRNSFFPSPKVVSAVVIFEKRDELIKDGRQRENYIRLIRMLFAQRRKTVKNNLAAARVGNIEELLRKAGVDAGKRAEELEREDFVRLAEEIYL